MNIVVFGAGAIGSLFGGLLSKNNKVVLVGRKDHIDSINKKGLTIKGKTNLDANVSAVENVKNIDFTPDIIILSVKSYDTGKAAESIKKIVGKKTIIISLQNGLDNIEKIKKHVKKEQIVVCITTHGSVFLESGYIKHTGVGKTVIGSFQDKCNNISSIAKLFDKVGIKTTVSHDILKEMWIKAVVNSSINPLTTIFNCKNGYLLENPVLKDIVEKICYESTTVANSCGYSLEKGYTLNKTVEVIEDTKENFSSMLQSVQNNKKTEIDSINGIIFKKARENNIDANLNKLLIHLVKDLKL